MWQKYVDIRPDLSRSVLQEIDLPEAEAAGVRLLVKRDDLIHPVISGNKWRKLLYNIEVAESKGAETLVTFGGAWSNHLHATAMACRQKGIPCVGIVRGDELSPSSNPCLQDCHDMGMQLEFVSRSDYRRKADKDYLAAIHDRWHNAYVVPEGGSNYYGMCGASDLATELGQADAVLCAVGTGTTVAGLVWSGAVDKVYAVPVLKGFDLLDEVRTLYTRSGIEAEVMDECLSRIHPVDGAHAGGYGKVDKELETLIEEVDQNYDLALDPIYTAKAWRAMKELLTEGEIEQGSTLVFLHTGGLQGARGLQF